MGISPVTIGSELAKLLVSYGYAPADAAGMLATSQRLAQQVIQPAFARLTAVSDQPGTTGIIGRPLAPALLPKVSQSWLCEEHDFLVRQYSPAVEPLKEKITALLHANLRLVSPRKRDWLDLHLDTVEFDELLPVFYEVIKDRVARGEGLPDLDLHARVSFVDERLMDESWVGQVERGIASYPSFGTAERPIPLTKMGDGDSHVDRVTLYGTTCFFRPLRYRIAYTPKEEPGWIVTATPRRTYAAFQLNRMLGLKTVPRARLAVVNGAAGVLSAAVPGRMLEADERYGDQFDRDQIRLVEAFEFLAGNYDSHRFNLHLDIDGTVQIFDHDQAFTRNIPRLRYGGCYFEYNDLLRERHWYPLGRFLPGSYADFFLEALQSLSPERIRAGFSEMSALI